LYSVVKQCSYTMTRSLAGRSSSGDDCGGDDDRDTATVDGAALSSTDALDEVVPVVGASPVYSIASILFAVVVILSKEASRKCRQC
jgi:hypothetical protein